MKQLVIFDNSPIFLRTKTFFSRALSEVRLLFRPLVCTKILKLCTYITISHNFDINAEVSSKKVIAFYRKGKIC